MQTIKLIQEMQRLSLEKKIELIEETLKSIKKNEINNQMLIAAERLYDDYGKDKELTAFNSLDLEDFYEVRWNMADWFRSYKRGRNKKNSPRHCD